jgi:hypothetical protein
MKLKSVFVAAAIVAIGSAGASALQVRVQPIQTPPTVSERVLDLAERSRGHFAHDCNDPRVSISRTGNARTSLVINCTNAERQLGMQGFEMTVRDNDGVGQRVLDRYLTMAIAGNQAGNLNIIYDVEPRQGDDRRLELLGLGLD